MPKTKRQHVLTCTVTPRPATAVNLQLRSLKRERGKYYHKLIFADANKDRFNGPIKKVPVTWMCGVRSQCDRLVKGIVHLLATSDYKRRIILPGPSNGLLRQAAGKGYCCLQLLDKGGPGSRNTGLNLKVFLPQSTKKRQEDGI